MRRRETDSTIVRQESGIICKSVEIFLSSSGLNLAQRRNMGAA
jgi:hypothetical protein